MLETIDSAREEANLKVSVRDRSCLVTDPANGSWPLAVDHLVWARGGIGCPLSVTQVSDNSLLYIG